jgi:DNA-binding winged helix-turn-helix (wHTH) protein
VPELAGTDERVPRVRACYADVNLMAQSDGPFRFGIFELDIASGELRKDGVPVRLPPQPFKLLILLASQAGRVVSRDEIRTELWSDGTTVDFDQGVNFSIKQVREALGDDAEQPRYIQTVPKRGYRFIAPVTVPQPQPRPRTALTDIKLQKALWANIAEIRLAQERRRKLLKMVAGVALALGALVTLLLLWR